MPSQIKWLQLFPSLEDLLRKVFLTWAASAFLSISPQIGNLSFALRSHPCREADRRSHRPQLNRQNRRLQREKKSFVVQIVEKQ